MTCAVEEILHQLIGLIGGLSRIVIGVQHVSTIQGGARFRFHPQCVSPRTFQMCEKHCPKSATSPHRVPGTMPPGGGNPVEVIVPLRECIITDSSSYAYLKYIASYNQKLDDIP
jgi:hypothetical protein